MTASVSQDQRPPWYRLPMVWLIIALFGLAVTGSVWMIILGNRHSDEPIAGVGERVLKVPVSRAPAKDGR